MSYTQKNKITTQETEDNFDSKKEGRIKTVLLMRLEGYPLKKIGVSLGISRARTGQIEVFGVDRLRLKNPPRNKRDDQARYKNRRDYFLNYQKRYRLNNPEKVRAKLLIKQAVESGKIEKGNCEVCGDINSKGHHPDYSKLFEVIWLCQKHHLQLHHTQ